MLVVDTNVFVAAVDAADPDHAACAKILESHPGPLVTTALVIAEAGWLIERQLDATAEAAFYTSITTGEITVEDLTIADWARIVALVATYADLDLGGVDASVVAIAERHQVTTIATARSPRLPGRAPCPHHRVRTHPHPHQPRCLLTVVFGPRVPARWRRRATSRMVRAEAIQLAAFWAM